MKKLGKVVVIEGLDGSGKATQTGLLFKYLRERNLNVERVSFPDYDSPSSSLVRMYLDGEFGSAPGDVNGHAAASFYAVDRYASYKKGWERFYNDGGIILCDRYVTSNAIYQMTKVPVKDWDEYLIWLEDLEYAKLGVPKPDIVIYLDVPIEISQCLMSNRYAGDESKKDLHEKDLQYLKNCREGAFYASRKLGWHVISCSCCGKMCSIEDVFLKVRNTVEKNLNI